MDKESSEQIARQREDVQQLVDKIIDEFRGNDIRDVRFVSERVGATDLSETEKEMLKKVCLLGVAMLSLGAASKVTGEEGIDFGQIKGSRNKWATEVNRIYGMLWSRRQELGEFNNQMIQTNEVSPNSLNRICIHFVAALFEVKGKP